MILSTRYYHSWKINSTPSVIDCSIREHTHFPMYFSTPYTGTITEILGVFASIIKCLLTINPNAPDFFFSHATPIFPRNQKVDVYSPYTRTGTKFSDPKGRYSQKPVLLFCCNQFSWIYKKGDMRHRQLGGEPRPYRQVLAALYLNVSRNIRYTLFLRGDGMLQRLNTFLYKAGCIPVL